MDVKEKWENFNYKRKLIILKFTLGRGYQWCQMPTLAIIGAGVIKPYLPMFDFWQLGLMAISIFLGVGWIDRKLKLLHEEQSYGTEVNPLLMKGLFRGKNPLTKPKKKKKK